MERLPLLILTALRHEAAAIAPALQRRGRDIQIEVIGPAACDLARLKRRPVRGILLAGVAGALDPELSAGDIVVDQLSDVGDCTLPWRKAKVACAANIIATPQEKAQLHRTTGASVVDMESEPARRLAAEWGVPYIGLRSVLDRADEMLDPALLRLLDSRGRIRVPSLAAELVRRPSLLLTLLHLRRRSALALRSLAAAVQQLVEEWEKRSLKDSKLQPSVP